MQNPHDTWEIIRDTFTHLWIYWTQNCWFIHSCTILDIVNITRKFMRIELTKMSVFRRYAICVILHTVCDTLLYFKWQKKLLKILSDCTDWAEFLPKKIWLQITYECGVTAETVSFNTKVIFTSFNASRILERKVTVAHTMAISQKLSITPEDWTPFIRSYWIKNVASN